MHELFRVLPRPELTGDPGQEWFQYKPEDQTAAVLMALKAVRIVSGLNAAMRLGEHGFTQEMAVLLRTVDDFIDEILFVLAGEQPGAERNQQEKFMQQFFSSVILSQDQILALQGDVHRVGKKKIRAGQSRLLDPSNPHAARQLALGVDYIWDGYVHGGYPQIMEMFNGGSGTFHLGGMAGTIRVPQYQRQHAYYVYRAIVTIALLAYQMKQTVLAELLETAAKTYAASGEYDASDENG